MQKLIIIGHRGAMAHKPENTLSSFQKAIELGADVIELDVYLSKDNHAIVIHDKSVDRTTNGKGNVNELTLEEIKQLTVEENETIPTLQDVIDLAKGKCKINIEVKDEKALEESIRIVKKNQLEDEVIISSFIQDVIKKSKEINSRIKTALLFVTAETKHLELANNLNAYYLHVHHSMIDKEFLEKAHNLNLKINVWGANNKKSVKKMV
ncbi:glycerophosphodiester phosphodiesterase, partial [Candidatus Woesearchaeota archaeon]|nr:glycerophosphodiester phosphodiesterase [Candidatus Woesearchaeota archaeon]